MDQQQAANGGSAADFVTDGGAASGVVGVSDVPSVTLNGASTQSAGSGTTSPTNNGLNNNEAKRAKLDPLKQPNAPSKVIHIRNIPNDVTEAEIIHLGIPFGRVTNVLVLKGKNQAFLEMDEESSGKNFFLIFEKDVSIFLVFFNIWKLLMCKIFQKKNTLG